MTIWNELLGNQVLISAVLGWTVAQFLKTVIDMVLNRSFNPERIFGSGGMPSSHSATVCALTTASGMKYGVGSFEFAVSFVLAMIVMYDAMGVRRETGKQAKLLNSVFFENILNLDGVFLQEKLKETLFQLEDSARTHAFGQEILTQALFQEFMVYLNRIFLEKQYIYDKKSYSYDSQIASLLQYINHNLQADLSVEKLAARYYVSKYHLMRKFKEETGYTLHNYIVSKRLLMARSLIDQGMPVIKAAQESGFAEYSTFSRAYRKQFQQSPGASKKQQTL